MDTIKEPNNNRLVSKHTSSSSSSNDDTTILSNNRIGGEVTHFKSNNELAFAKDYMIGSEIIDSKRLSRALDMLEEHNPITDQSTTIYLLFDDTHLQLNEYLITLSKSIFNHTNNHTTTTTTNTSDDTTTTTTTNNIDDTILPVSCTCPDHIYRLKTCKHMIAIHIILSTTVLRPEDIGKVKSYMT